MRYTGPVHFRYSGTEQAKPGLESLARVFLGQLQAVYPNVATKGIYRSGNGWTMRVLFSNGAPIVDIRTTGGGSSEDTQIVDLYVESGILDVLTWIAVAEQADTPAQLSYAPEHTPSSPTGTIRFIDGKYSYTGKGDGVSGVTGGGFEDKARRVTPPSVFSGKLRLYVQSLYGSRRTNFFGTGGVVLVEDVLLSPTFVGGSILYTTDEDVYWLVTFGEIITARRLLLGPIAILVWRMMRAGALTRISAEPYIFVDSKWDDTQHVIGGIEVAGAPLTYGWQATTDGRTAKIVTIEPHGFSHGFTSYTYTVAVSTQEGGTPSITKHVHVAEGAIDVLDSVIVSTDYGLERRIDMIGTFSGVVDVGGFFTSADEWVSIQYQSSGSARGFFGGLEARVPATATSEIVAPTATITLTYEGRGVLFGSQLSGLAWPHGGMFAPGAPPFPEGYGFDDRYWVYEQFAVYQSGSIYSGTISQHGSSIIVFPHYDCTAYYALTSSNYSLLNASGHRGTIEADYYMSNAPQLIHTAVYPPALISDGNPPHSLELQYMKEKSDYPFTAWQGPQIYTNSRNAVGYTLSGVNASFVYYTVDYRSSITGGDSILSVSTGTTTSGVVRQGRQAPGYGIEFTDVSLSSEIASYVTGYGLDPTSPGDIGNWAQIYGLDLVNTGIDMSLFSYESYSGKNPYARQPNGAVFRHTPGDTPSNLVMVGRI